MTMMRFTEKNIDESSSMRFISEKTDDVSLMNDNDESSSMFINCSDKDIYPILSRKYDA